jgi:hypothetical protein
VHGVAFQIGAGNHTNSGDRYAVLTPLPQVRWRRVHKQRVLIGGNEPMTPSRAGGLTANKNRAPRRTIQPSVCQGMVSCSKCRYALYRTSARTSVRKIYYYRCLGSDGWRYLNGAVCNSPPIREELLDQVVWNEIVKLLENPRLIEEELDRRLEIAQKAFPTQRRQESLQRDLTRVHKSMERLMTAYQEDLLSLDELRSRMPDLRQRKSRAMPARAAIKVIMFGPPFDFSIRPWNDVTASLMADRLVCSRSGSRPLSTPKPTIPRSMCIGPGWTCCGLDDHVYSEVDVGCSSHLHRLLDDDCGSIVVLAALSRYQL